MWYCTMCYTMLHLIFHESTYTCGWWNNHVLWQHGGGFPWYRFATLPVWPSRTCGWSRYHNCCRSTEERQHWTISVPRKFHEVRLLFCMCWKFDPPKHARFLLFCILHPSGLGLVFGSCRFVSSSKHNGKRMEYDDQRLGLGSYCGWKKSCTSW
jgi:hypothetical protein